MGLPVGPMRINSGGNTDPQDPLAMMDQQYEKDIAKQKLRGTMEFINPPPGYEMRKMEQIDHGTSNGYDSVNGYPGLIEKGNIDLKKRPVVYNGDGSISTELSFGYNDGSSEVVLPQIVGGKKLTIPDAIEHYQKTKEHLGKFKSGDIVNANGYSEKLHSRGVYVKGKKY